MEKSIRPLWQLLLLTSESKEPVHLTCEECITLLEYDAEFLVDGTAFDELPPAVRFHLSICSKCRAKIDEWLGNLSRA